MTVRKLIEILEDFDPETEVRLAVQPNYPLQHDIAGVVHTSELTAEMSQVYAGDKDAEVVWILEGSTPDQPYGSKDWWYLV